MGVGLITAACPAAALCARRNLLLLSRLWEKILRSTRESSSREAFGVLGGALGAVPVFTDTAAVKERTGGASSGSGFPER